DAGHPRGPFRRARRLRRCRPRRPARRPTVLQLRAPARRPCAGSQVLFSAGGERRAVFWVAPALPILPSAPSMAEGGASGDDSHCPRRTQLVVKVTLRVVGLKRGRLSHATRSGPSSLPPSGRSLPSPPGLGPVPLRPLHGGARP